MEVRAADLIRRRVAGQLGYTGRSPKFQRKAAAIGVAVDGTVVAKKDSRRLGPGGGKTSVV